MARITVEDCLSNVDNRFHLVLVATKRARQLSHGAQSHLDWENDKPTVLALREIAEGLVGPSVLDEVVAEEHAPEPDEVVAEERTPEPDVVANEVTPETNPKE